MFSLAIYLTASCDYGDLRVVGGGSVYEGRLEVCLDQRWGTINVAGWTSRDNQVACRQLGFETTGELKLCLYA